MRTVEELEEENRRLKQALYDISRIPVESRNSYEDDANDMRAAALNALRQASLHPSVPCWRCDGRKVIRVYRGEPSQGSDVEPCDVCQTRRYGKR